MHVAYKKVLQLHAVTQPKILSNMTRFTTQELKEMYPNTCKVADPDVWVHGVSQDITAIRSIARKPAYADSSVPIKNRNWR